jgi:hypothetical protein
MGALLQDGLADGTVGRNITLTLTSTLATNATRVEAGSNTSTVTLWVVGVDEKGSLKSERVKYGHESQETRTWERLPGEGQEHIQMTDSSSRQTGRPTETRP